MRGPAPTISSSASVDLTLYRSRPESLLGFHSCVEPSHNEVLACCSRLMLLHIEEVDRYAKRHELLSLLLQCRDKKKPLPRTKRPTDLRNQQALFLTPLFYTKDSHYVDRWCLEGDTPLDKASIEGSLSPLSSASSCQTRTKCRDYD